MADLNVTLNMPSELHFTFTIPELDELRVELRQGMQQLCAILRTMGELMSEAADQLTAAVQAVQTGFDTLNTTLQTEMSEITAALTSAGTDQALRDAAIDAVTRLGTLATSIGNMNTTIQGIIP